MSPPYKITPKMNDFIAKISRFLGQFEAITHGRPSPKLRRQNRIRTIKSTLAIEGHSFTEDQVTAVIENRRVIGAKREILEVKNAMELYRSMDVLKSSRLGDFLKAHKILMEGLVSSAGKYRSKNVGILEGTKIKHVAPKPNMVPALIAKVFHWAKRIKNLHPLILSSVIHYEIEFIHPFEDGNGRIGRFWQGLILKEYDELFQYVPIESLIEKKQKQYYLVLEKSDQAGESTFFVEFMLDIIYCALEEMSRDLVGIISSCQDRIQNARQRFGDQVFARKDYMTLFKNISGATASRDLARGVLEGEIIKRGAKNQARYHFV